MVTLVDHRCRSSPARTRVRLRVEAYANDNILAAPGVGLPVWFVEANHLLQALQSSPALVHGLFFLFGLAKITNGSLGPARLSTVQIESDSHVYDVFASIGGESRVNCISYPLVVSQDAIEVHVQEVCSNILVVIKHILTSTPSFRAGLLLRPLQGELLDESYLSRQPKALQ